MTKEENCTEVLLKEIIARCFEISTQTKADVFFDYHPHITSISIRIYLDGWSTNSDCLNMKYKGEQIINFGSWGTESLVYALEELDRLYEKYKQYKKYKQDMKLAEEVKKE